MSQPLSPKIGKRIALFSIGLKQSEIAAIKLLDSSIINAMVYG
jgi:hypothetical protein